MTSILFYGIDLSARLRLSRAASEVGAELVSQAVADPDAEPDVVIIDLDWAGASVEELARLHPQARVMGYYSHIDDNKRLAAERAGVQAVPRSRFWRETAGLIGHGLSHG